MGHDVIFAVPVVDERLENLNLLTGNLAPAKSPDQFLALAAEHAAGDDFDPSVMGFFPYDFHEDDILAAREPGRMAAIADASAGDPGSVCRRKGSDAGLVFAGFCIDSNL